MVRVIRQVLDIDNNVIYECELDGTELTLSKEELLKLISEHKVSNASRIYYGGQWCVKIRNI